jgi:DNA-binding protein HU-beta
MQQKLNDKIRMLVEKLRNGGLFNGVYQQNGAFINKIVVFFTETLVWRGYSDIFALINNYKHSKNLTMNKAELIDAMAAEAGLSKADAKKALDAFVSATANAMKGGDRISLVGFGSFSVSNRAARTGRNPQTGKEIKIAAKNVVRFKAGAELSAKVN